MSEEKLQAKIARQAKVIVDLTDANRQLKEDKALLLRDMRELAAELEALKV